MSEPRRNLWAPWRLDYLHQVVAPHADAEPSPRGEASGTDTGEDTSRFGRPPEEASLSGGVGGGSGGCFLCDAGDPHGNPDQDAQRLVLRRTGHCALLLNRYPYTNGHLLAAPHAHVGELSDLPPEARAELMELAEYACRLLKHVVHAQGFNVGLNVGRAAGAGVPGHLHLHVVPRWAGDTNFMDVVGGTRVIPQALEASYAMLREGMGTVG